VIRPLRARHRRAVAVLAVALPLGMAAALSARPPELDPAGSGARELERPGAAAPGPALARVFVRGFGPFGDLPLTAWLGRDEAGRTAIEFRPSGALLAPDLLAYWSPGRGPEQAGLVLADAVLLGRLGEGPRRFALPGEGSGGGYVVLHDLARGETVAVRAVPELVE
jgi:hypothetical protein